MSTVSLTKAATGQPILPTEPLRCGWTYAAYLVTGDRMHMIAMVDGWQADLMLASSTEPGNLRFIRS
jgi:hypothetical protein